MSRLPTILISCALAASLLAGCGDGGAASGSTVAVYVSAPLRGAEAGLGRPLCRDARREAGLDADEAGDLKLRVVCLDASGRGGNWTLARVGANARRATEDSTAVAYVGETDPAARRQSRPILDAAEMAAFGGLGGAEAVARVRAALEDDDAGDPRQAVFEAAGG